VDVTALWTTDEIARWAYDGWAEAGALLGDSAALGLAAAAIGNRIVATVVGLAAAALLGMHAHLFTSALSDDVAIGVGVALAVVVAIGALGGARNFVEGSVRAGGARAIVAVTVLVVAALTFVLSLFLVGVGYVLAAVVIGAAFRRRSASGGKYKGLRILR
jgi:hypothetical protein